MARAFVYQRMRGIEAETVEMILGNPVQGIFDEEAPHHLAVGTVQIQSGAPGRGVMLREVERTVDAQVIPVWPQVVVNHVEQDCQSQAVSRVHEAAEIVWPTVTPGRRG